MTESEELSYERGRRAIWSRLLGQCIVELGTSDKIDFAKLLKEREDAIACLRSACETFGNNDWPDTLYLADIIEKHLVDYLE